MQAANAVIPRREKESVADTFFLRECECRMPGRDAFRTYVVGAEKRLMLSLLEKEIA
jgi:hypothetical protein